MEAPPTLDPNAKQATSVHLTHRQILIIFSGLMLGMFLSALDNTIVTTALPSIVGDLGGQSQTTWVVTSYLLTSTITILLWGKLSDIYGRKVMFQISIALFLAASALVGLSQSMMFLVLARGLQGIGAGGIMSLAFAIIGDILSPRERGKYMGLMGSVFLVAMVVGPALGGLIVEHLHVGSIAPWRWVFYINLPIGIPALFITGIVLRLPFNRVKQPIDYAGFALLALGASSLILGLIWAGQPATWDSHYNLRWLPGVGDAAPLGGAAPTGAAAFLGDWLVTILLSSGLVLAAAFLVWEARTEHALLPLRLFKARTYSLGAAISFVVGAAMFGAFVFLPTYLQISTGVSATMSGFLMLPLMAGMFPFMTVSGNLVSKTGRYKFWPLIGLPTGGIGLFMLSFITATSPAWFVGLGMFVLGSGIGMTMQVVVVAVQNVLEMKDLGIGTSANTFMRQMGGVFGVGLFGAYYAHRIIGLIPGALAIARKYPGVDVRPILAGFQVNPGAVHDYPEELRTFITTGFADTVAHIFLFAAPVMLLGVVLVLFLKEIPLRSTRNVGGSAPTPAAQTPMVRSAEKAADAASGAPVLIATTRNGANGRGANGHANGNGSGNGHAPTPPGRPAVVSFGAREERGSYYGYELADLQARVDHVTRQRSFQR
jgi:MFS family permease